LAARARGDAGLKRLAVRFDVSHSWAQNVLRQSKLTGQAERVRHRPGPRSRMNDEIAAYMRQQAAGPPDLTLAELQQRLMSEKNIRFSIGRLWMLMRKLGLRLEKEPLQCAGINRHEVGNERVLRGRISDPLGPEFCVMHREVHCEA